MLNLLDREKFQKLLNEIKIELKKLVKSFSLGNVIKNGIPVDSWHSQCWKIDLIKLFS